MDNDELLSEGEKQVRDVLNKLREKGAVRVVAFYGGSGDEGEIYEIQALDEKEGELVLTREEKHALIEFTEEQLPSGYGDELGSQGQLHIDLLGWKAELMHEWRVESYTEDFSEVDLPLNEVTDGSDPEGRG